MHYQPIREKPLVGISLVGSNSSNKRITRPNSSGIINALPTDQDVMTLQEAAEFFKCNPATIKRRADALHIPYKRLGSLWRFSRKALEAWMADADNAMAA
jgi:excisionase family DNA binding protein